jgi:hypothetical protein
MINMIGCSMKKIALLSLLSLSLSIYSGDLVPYQGLRGSGLPLTSVQPAGPITSARDIYAWKVYDTAGKKIENSNPYAPKNEFNNSTVNNTTALYNYTGLAANTTNTTGIGHFNGMLGNYTNEPTLQPTDEPTEKPKSHSGKRSKKDKRNDGIGVAWGIFGSVCAGMLHDAIGDKRTEEERFRSSGVHGRDPITNILAFAACPTDIVLLRQEVYRYDTPNSERWVTFGEELCCYYDDEVYGGLYREDRTERIGTSLLKGAYQGLKYGYTKVRNCCNQTNAPEHVPVEEQVVPYQPVRPQMQAVQIDPAVIAARNRQANFNRVHTVLQNPVFANKYVPNVAANIHSYLE